MKKRILIISLEVLNNNEKITDDSKKENKIENSKDINNSRAYNDQNNNKEIIDSKGCEDLSDIFENNNLSDIIFNTNKVLNNNIPVDTHSSKESNEKNNESFIIIQTPSCYKS